MGTVSGAARLVQMDRHLHYDWWNDTRRFPDYRKRFDAADQRKFDLWSATYKRECRERCDALHRAEAELEAARLEARAARAAQR